MRRPIFHGLILAIVLATAFYATFLPSRASTRASGLVDPATGLSYSGAAVGRVAVEPQVSSQAVPQIATKSSFANPSSTGTSGGQSAGLLQNNPDARTAALGISSPGLAQPTAVASSMSAETAPPGDTAAAPAASATPVATPAAVSQLCDTSHSTRYCVYTVQAGDSLGSIATKFPHIKGNPAEDLAPHDYLVNSNKPDIISEDDLLQIGQSLRIPVINGVVHTVITSQTLVEIATAYGVEPKDIAGVSVNGINNADQLTIGQELVIPNPKRFGAPAPAPTPTPTAVPTTAPSAARSAAPADTAPAAAAKPATTSKSGFIWPVGGPISSYFGPSHPLGIDIDLYANPTAPIAAAAAGTVTFAGGSSCCSYGLYVIVDHGNGYSTLYAHLSKISVSVGQKVAQGAMLGNGGRTGYATGAHLHFEVHLNDAVINPMSVLP